MSLKFINNSNSKYYYIMLFMNNNNQVLNSIIKLMDGNESFSLILKNNINNIMILSKIDEMNNNYQLFANLIVRDFNKGTGIVYMNPSIFNLSKTPLFIRQGKNYAQSFMQDIGLYVNSNFCKDCKCNGVLIKDEYNNVCVDIYEIIKIYNLMLQPSKTETPSTGYKLTFLTIFVIILLLLFLFIFLIMYYYQKQKKYDYE